MDMQIEISIGKIRKEFPVELARVESVEAAEVLRVKYLGRKAGLVTNLMGELGGLSVEERKKWGPASNDLKRFIENALAEKERALESQSFEKDLARERADVTAPPLPPSPVGHRHPESMVREDLEDLFASMGFLVLDGPEIESDYYNFEAVNIPADHPARDMQDTFYLSAKDGSASGGKGSNRWLMRTHTSSVQVRAMKIHGAPLRAIVPGRVFRNEATDARHEHTFSQLEGVVIDRNITIAHLKGVIETVARHLYGGKTEVRLRPKFYPFVEPGVNGEVSCFLCSGKGCRVCKGAGWLEVFGAGMVHPNVLRAGSVDPKKYQGFAFGFGLTRLVMLKYGIEDVRLLQGGDMRFLSQF